MRRIRLHSTLRFVRALTSDVYTHGHHASVVGQHAARTAENSAAFLLPHLKKGDRLLDVGCGPGSITVGLARQVGGTGHVTAIDVDAGVVGQAAAAVQAARLDNTSCEVCSVYDLPYEDDSFDVAYAHQTLQHLSDPVRALAAMCRVVKPGGLLAIRDADYASMLGHPHSPAIDEWRRIYREVARRNGAEPDAGRHLVSWLLQASLPADSISYGASAVVYSPRDEPWRTNWGRAWAERTRHSNFGRQAVDYGLATPDQLERVSAAWEAWADDPTALFYYVNGEALARVPHPSGGARDGGEAVRAGDARSDEPAGQSYRTEPLLQVPCEDVREVARLLATGAARYIDCRSEAELGGGVVRGSVSIPFPHNGNSEVVPPHEFVADVESEGLARHELLLVGCRSGVRSALAAEVLVRAGFQDVRNVQGGILAWAAAGLPIEPFSG